MNSFKTAKLINLFVIKPVNIFENKYATEFDQS